MNSIRRPASGACSAMLCGRFCGVAIPLLSLVLAGSVVEEAAAGPITQTFVMAVGGQSNWSTFGAPQPVFDFFGATGPGIPSNPAGLAASGIAGDYRLTTFASGTGSDSISVTSPNFATTWSSSNVFSGSAQANATAGKVGASANGTFNGWGDAFTVAGTEAFGLNRETFTISSPSIGAGTTGYVQFHYTVDGAMSISGVGTGGIGVNYQQGTGPIYNLMHASVDPRFAPGFYPFSGDGRAGFSITSTAISGKGTFDTFSLPMQFGNAFDFTFALLAYTIPAKNASIGVNFSSTALLTGIDVFDASGNKLTDFAVTGDSGAQYGPNGVVLRQTDPGTPVVPEPTSLAMFATFGLTTLISGWRRRSMRQPSRESAA